MKAKTQEEINEIARLKKELKTVKRLLADEILDHRIDQAMIEILAREYKIDVEQLKKKDSGMTSSRGSASTASVATGENGLR